MMPKISKMTETLAYGFSSIAIQSTEYQHDRVWTFLENLSVLVLWTRVPSTLEGYDVYDTFQSGAKQDFTQSTQGARLSETLEVENLEERRLMELVHQPWEPPPPAKRQVKKR